MSLFKQKPKKEDESERKIRELREFRDIGETFNYLGRTCIVFSHSEYWNVPRVGSGYRPLLQCNYADNNGVIQNANFGHNELPALIKQNLNK